MYNTLNVTNVGGSSVAAGLNTWPAAPASERLRELEAGKGGRDGRRIPHTHSRGAEGGSKDPHQHRGGLPSLSPTAMQGGTVPSPGHIPVCPCSPPQAIQKVLQGMLSK